VALCPRRESRGGALKVPQFGGERARAAGNEQFSPDAPQNIENC